jgi:hypothetical protein
VAAQARISDMSRGRTSPEISQSLRGFDASKVLICDQRLHRYPSIQYRSGHHIGRVALRNVQIYDVKWPSHQTMPLLKRSL